MALIVGGIALSVAGPLEGLTALQRIADRAAFHNNYVPWFSIWVVLAIAETWAIPGAISARLVAAPPAGARAGPG